MSVSVSLAALMLAFAPVDSGEAVAPEQPSTLDSRAADTSEKPAPTAEVVASPAMPATTPAAIPPDAPFPEDVVEETEIYVSARRRAPPPGDPLERANALSFEVTQAVEQAVVRPVALGYRRIVPDPVRSGIRNAINNLREPVVFLNFMLQHKLGKAAETIGRFAINSTIGAAGLFDMAKRRPFKLPRRPNGLANTLGFYGVKTGAYLYLPLIGPTTVRDMIGDTLDRLVLPIAVGEPFNRPYVGIPIAVFSSLDQHAEFDEKLQALHEDSDPYAATREDYLRHREAVIAALHVKHHKAVEPAAPPAPPVPVN